MRAINGEQKRSFLASTGLAVILTTIASSVYAQQQSAATDADGVQLKPIVIKNNRATSGSVSDSPLANVITAQEIRQSNVDSIKDLTNTLEPGLAVSTTTGGVNIRGLQNDRVLTTIDGIPIPYLDAAIRGEVNGGSADAYDLSALSTFDVLYGADASRLGSGAMGGAIALQTLEPEDLLAPGKAFGGLVKLTYDGSDRSFISSGAVAQKVQNTSVLFQGSYKRGHEIRGTGDIGGYGPARTEADPRDYDRSNLMFKLRQELEGGHTIGITAERNRYDSDTNLNSDAGTTYDNRDYNQNRKNDRDRVSLDYRYESQNDGLVNNARATLYWQKMTRSYGTDTIRFGALAGPFSRHYKLEDERYGATGYANLGFDTGTLSHSLTVGGDFSVGKNTQSFTGDDACIRGSQNPTCSFLHINQADTPDVDSYRFGMFAEDRISIGDTPFAVTPGLRFDWFKYEPDSISGYDNNTDSRISPKIRFSWQATPALELFAQISTTYKAPQVDQLYVTYLSAGYATIGNPNLSAEKGYGIDIGANFGTQDSGGKITAFVNRYNDFIDTVTTRTTEFPLGLTEYRNLDKARIAGIEFKAHHNFVNGFNVHGSFAYAKAMNLDEDIPLASALPFKGVFGVGYNAETWGVDSSVVAAAYVNQTISTRAGTTTRRLPGYGIVNLTGWWEPTQLNGTRLQAGVYNIFDKTYYDAMNVNSVENVTERWSEAGRYFKISLTQKF
ncbi:TonB-dependent hemoglobin/transferrin/lactoferrin family receptor [Ochrobactrum sp. Marseille-Q0166]|uniref:TonB-dependent hemoglobin/transferrin/lactoferrin family receptor n=1 Tax=Ochrobactrum sp. Marseille-Q0166 TaxID=2761105 RepID=UPI0016559C50|nr:TonB-dependent hemoglobin/transferrin/lactoferrin family receptor [Ochrobactrum sp. Marseille-Q0166]MBC8718230.1 TonB-dependent hemoglobin/transferrin/lactoferrin family receptor [Ochrobactrum sp. Marseille-Q0166]